MKRSEGDPTPVEVYWIICTAPDQIIQVSSQDVLQHDRGWLEADLGARRRNRWYCGERPSPHVVAGNHVLRIGQGPVLTDLLDEGPLLGLNQAEDGGAAAELLPSLVGHW